MNNHLSPSQQRRSKAANGRRFPGYDPANPLDAALLELLQALTMYLRSNTIGPGVTTIEEDDDGQDVDAGDASLT